MTCDAKIRPFPGHDEIACEEDGDHATHTGVIRNKAYPGSETKLSWMENDRRTFRGVWTPCDQSDCILPAGHHGNHAV